MITYDLSQNAKSAMLPSMHMDEQLRTVLSDLDYLYDEWDQNIDDDSLRRDSVVLRRLLVYRDLLKAWRKIGFQGEPEITAPTLEEHLKLFPLSTVRFALAGGANYKGNLVAVVFERDEASTPEQIKKDFELGPVYEVKFKQSEFMESACVIVEGVKISRRELVQYVANKLGAAHYDENLNESQRLLKYAQQSYEISGKVSIYFELLSIGQRLVRSTDIDKLRQALRALSKR